MTCLPISLSSFSILNFLNICPFVQHFPNDQRMLQNQTRKKSIQGAKCLLSPSDLILFKAKVSLMFSWSDELSIDANVVFESLAIIVYFSLCMLTQLCPTLCGPVDCSPSGSSTHDIFQARILEWVAVSYSRASS